MQKIKLVFVIIVVIICAILFFKAKRRLKRDAYQKGEENRKKRLKK